MSLPRTTALALGLALCLAAPSARAALDPTRAEADTQALVKANDYSFCTKPAHPLSGSARQLCPLAGEIPGCSALVAACAEEDKPPELGPFWEKLLRALARALPYVAWALIAALVGLVGYLVLRAIRAARDPVLPSATLADAEVTLLPDTPVPDAMTPAEALLRLAAEARARGDARTALFTYLAAALRALDDRGAIRVSRDRTNGEYVRGCQESSARPGLRTLVREVDSVQFGGREATLEAAAAAEVQALAIVRAPSRGPSGLPTLATLATVALAALATLAGACKLDALSHDDPAGRGLLVDLLEKQGAVVSSVTGSLAHLPMHGTKGPAIVLDAENVPLEEATRAHLMAWVNQGGTLVLAGDPSLWPSELWAKRASADAAACDPGKPDAATTKVRVETRERPAILADDDDDDDLPVSQASAPTVQHATLAHRAAMVWPSEDRAPRAIARFDDGELYGALRTFGRGKVLGLANGELFRNVALAVPGNASAAIALLAAVDKQEFAVARAEQGVTPPENPLAGLMHVGLGPALVHAAIFIPLLFFAFGVRASAPRAEPPAQRRAFAEHVQAVGGLYTRRRAGVHALAVYAKLVDGRVRAAMGRGTDPVEFLAARSGVSRADAAETAQRALAAQAGDPAQGDELRVLQRLVLMFARAMEKR